MKKESKNIAPSQEFLEAVKDYKLVWGKNRYVYYHPKMGRRNGKIATKKFNLIKKLGFRDGLSEAYIKRKVYSEDEPNCLVCNKEFTTRKGDESYYAYMCDECKYKMERQDWKDDCDFDRKEEAGLRYYSDKIRGYIPDYELSFEENQERQKQRAKIRHENSVASQSRMLQGVMERMDPPAKHDIILYWKEKSYLYSLN